MPPLNCDACDNHPTGAEHFVELRIDVPGSTAFWSFSIVDHGIEFEATFTPDFGGESVVLQDCTKFKAKEHPVVKGQHTLQEPGCCVFRFNNKYSMATGKTITDYEFSIIGVESSDGSLGGCNEGFEFSYAQGSNGPFEILD